MKLEENYVEMVEKLVNKKINNIKEAIVPLNNNKPIFDEEEYKTIEGEPKYFEPDEYERSTGAIALITKNTIPLVINKKLDYPNPYGWTKNLENKNLFQRCHIIAYSLSAKLADKKNIFIGTKDLNKSIMSKAEIRVKNYVQNNNARILYKVTIKYKGKNQIPTGILIEAESLDDEFSICEFYYNIQENVEFSYKNGDIIEDKRILNKTKTFIKNVIGIKSNTKKKAENKNSDFIINRKTNEIHLKDSECSKLKNVQSKYINETTATKKALLKVNLKPCKQCMDN